MDLSEPPGRPGDPAPSANIQVDGEPTGHVTSAGPGLRTGTRVCLGYVRDRYAHTDSGFTIDTFGALCPATRHRHAAYDPDHERPRS